MGFPRKLSLRSGREIKGVLDQGYCVKDEILRIHLLPADESSLSRVAFLVPRYGHTIVSRNRLKRRLQEIFRRHPGLSRGYSVVVRVSPAGYDASFQELEKRFSTLVERVKIALHPPE